MSATVFIVIVVLASFGFFITMISSLWLAMVWAMWVNFYARLFGKRFLNRQTYPRLPHHHAVLPDLEESMMSRTTRKRMAQNLAKAVNDMVSEGGNVLIADNKAVPDGQTAPTPIMPIPLPPEKTPRGAHARATDKAFEVL